METLTLKSAITLLLDHEGLKATRVNENLLRIHISTGEDELVLGALLNIEAGAAAFYWVHPDKVPEDRRGTAAIALMKFNYGLMAGALELDHEDGELRVRTGVDFGNGPASVQALYRALELNLGLLTTARPLFDALCAGAEE